MEKDLQHDPILFARRAQDAFFSSFLGRDGSNSLISSATKIKDLFHHWIFEFGMIEFQLFMLSLLFFSLQNHALKSSITFTPSPFHVELARDRSQDSMDAQMRTEHALRLAGRLSAPGWRRDVKGNGNCLWPQ